MAEAQFFVGVHGVIANRGRIILLKRAERMLYKPGSRIPPHQSVLRQEVAEFIDRHAGLADEAS